MASVFVPEPLVAISNHLAAPTMASAAATSTHRLPCLLLSRPGRRLLSVVPNATFRCFHASPGVRSSVVVAANGTLTANSVPVVCPNPFRYVLLDLNLYMSLGITSLDYC